MSEDETMYHLKENYTAIFGYLLEEDGVEAVEMHREYGINELELDKMLDALNRQGYIEKVDSRDGELYDAEDFDLENHQEIIEDFELL